MSLDGDKRPSDWSMGRNFRNTNFGIYGPETVMDLTQFARVEIEIGNFLERLVAIYWVNASLIRPLRGVQGRIPFLLLIRKSFLYKLILLLERVSMRSFYP